MIVKLLYKYLISAAAIAPKLLAASAEVVSYNGVCRVKNMLCRTVILFKLYLFYVLYFFIKVKNVFYCCATELIYALVVIANDHNVAASARKQKCKLQLSMVCVLKLIHKNIIKLSLILCEYVGMVAE